MVDPVIAQLLARIADAPAHDNVARAAVFDADGTLWRDDIGEVAFARGVADGMIAQECYREHFVPWAARYAIALPHDATAGVRALSLAHDDGTLAARARELGETQDAWRSSLYGMQACAFCGHTREAVLQYGERLFANGVADSIYPRMQTLIDGLRRINVDVWIASASHGALVQAGAQRFNVAADHVLGMEAATDNAGALLFRVERSTYGACKRDAVSRALGGRQALLAAGDSVLFTDRALLASAHISLAVAPRAEHRAAAITLGYLVFDP